MAEKKTPVYEKSMTSWALASNGKLQALLFGVIMIAVAARVVPLEMQKRIVNEAIKFRQIDLLAYYCGIYLSAIIVSNIMKYLINVLQAVISERALKNMRMALFEHILVLPLIFFRKSQPGTVVSFLLTELSTAGNFAGMALATPLVNVLTLLAFAGYLFWLNPLLAAISLSIYPLVLILVPLVQRGANIQNKRRVDVSREYSGKISEAVSGIQEIQANGAFTIENRKYTAIVIKLQRIRIVWNMFMNGVKSLNNLFSSIGPLLIFIIGGYLTMRGRLELGALVAFLSAQEKLYDPWKELIDYYQVYQDAAVRYRRTMEYFRGAPEFQLLPLEQSGQTFAGRLTVDRLSFTTDDGMRLLDDVSFELNPGEHLALVGFSGSGKSTLVQCLGQLFKYTGGHARLDGREIADLSKKEIIDHIGIISQAPFIFDGTIQDNLLYSWAAKENGQGPPGPPPHLDQMAAVLQQVGLFTDVLNFGLNAVLDTDKYGSMVPLLIRTRHNFQKDFGENLAQHVEFFSEDHYLYYSSVAENLIFGASRIWRLDPAALAADPLFISFLERAGLLQPLISLGFDLAKQTVDILGDFPLEAVFFEQSPILMEEFSTYKDWFGSVKEWSSARFSEAERRRLLTLGLRFCPGKHKMVALSTALQTRILEGRQQFRHLADKKRPDEFIFYRLSTYIFSESILSNILYGKLKSSAPWVREKIGRNIIHLLIEEGLLEQMIEIGMQFMVGSKGENLSGGQKQKLAVARVLLKQPKVLLMDEATASLDNKSQARIQNMIETRLRGNTTVISVAHRLDIVKGYDKIAVMKAGKIVEIGAYEELLKKHGVLYELVHGKK